MYAYNARQDETRYAHVRSYLTNRHGELQVVVPMQAKSLAVGVARRAKVTLPLLEILHNMEEETPVRFVLIGPTLIAETTRQRRGAMLFLPVRSKHNTVNEFF